MRVISIKKEQILLVIFVTIISIVIFKSFNNKVVPAFSMPLSNKVIVIDAGHGGWDPGKVSSEQVLEKDINLQIAKKLQAYLEQAGAFVITTRQVDEALGDSKNSDMQARKQLANMGGIDMFISIHQNSYTSEDVKGTQCFYYENSKDSKDLAECIQKEIKEFTGQKGNRVAKADSSYYVLRETTVPAVIVECGFLSSPQEAKLLADDQYQEKMAWAIYKGILGYYNN